VTDVVEQGRAPVGGGPHRRARWVRRAVVAGLVIVAAAVVSRTGLLSRSDGPQPVGPTASAQSNRPVVFVEGGRLVRYRGTAVTRGAALPPGRLAEPGWFVVTSVSGGSSVFGVVGGQLVHVTGARAVTIGPAARLVDVSRTGLLFLQPTAGDGGTVVALDATIAQVVDRAPFPGDTGADGWAPVGVLSLFDADALLLRHTAVDGDQLELAWAAGEVRSGRADPVQALAGGGVLVGVLHDRVLVRDRSCPAGRCLVSVLSVRRGGSQLHPVRAPAGWSFAPVAPPGRSRAALTLVRRVGAPGTAALARIVPGGDTALLVPGSAGLVVATGLVEDGTGAVFFVRTGSAGRTLMTWDPDRSGPAQVVRMLPRQRADARLVCVCG
jgi:hypothetical protein